MAPKLNRRRAVFVLSKIDEILSWENGTVGDPLFQGLQGPTSCNRAGIRNCWPDAWERQVARLLLGDDLCGFFGGSELGVGNQDALLPCLTRLVIGLPKPQRNQLLEEVRVTL